MQTHRDSCCIGFLQELFAKLSEESIPVLQMSTVTEEGVAEVRNEACDLLLAHRMEAKLKGKKVEGILNRLHVAMPKPRDSKVGHPCAPLCSAAVGTSAVAGIAK